MTSLTLNTPAIGLNTVLSMPASSDLHERLSNAKKFMSYTVTPKSWYRKSTVKFSSIDWDVNMNELEFE